MGDGHSGYYGVYLTNNWLAMIKYIKDHQDIVTLTLDMEGRAKNLINHEIVHAFFPILEKLKEEKAKGQLKGVILTSNKTTFLAGGDFDYLYDARDPAQIFAYTQQMKGLLRAFEQPGVPVVAAINGDALSIGFEVALAAHHRVVVNDSSIRLGLPELKIGLIPGNGGIIRLMWLLGLVKAYDVIAAAKIYSPKMALHLGLVDQLANSHEQALHLAKQWILHHPEGRRPWDQAGATIPGGNVQVSENNDEIYQLNASILSQYADDYPAYKALLEVLIKGSLVDFDTACRIESRYYTKLLSSQVCKNMIQAFWFNRKAIEKGINRPKGYGRFRPRTIGIIGAGQMGARIATACLHAGLEVILKDVSKLIAEKARDYAHSFFEAKVERNALAAHDLETVLSRLHTTGEAKDFESCDLVIEAVFENEPLKQKVTKEASAYLDEFAILGSNSISIPISDLAKATHRPENYVGLHFFHPADQVPMVEIVKGARTSEETVSRAFDFVRAIGKIPIVVKDGWGFYAARVQNTYILEGITMLQEGISPVYVENLGRQSGMPKGPLALADDLGLSTVLKYEQQAAKHYGTKYLQHPAVKVLDKMLWSLERPGHHRHGGFYEYSSSTQQAQLWAELKTHFSTQDIPVDRQEIKDRFLFAQVVEALWCLQEGVIHSVPAANLGSIYGWGFPSFQGGVIQFIQAMGVGQFTIRCSELTAKFGPRFQLAKPLHKKLEQLF